MALTSIEAFRTTDRCLLYSQLWNPPRRIPALCLTRRWGGWPAAGSGPSCACTTVYRNAGQKYRQIEHFLTVSRGRIFLFLRSSGADSKINSASYVAWRGRYENPISIPVNFKPLTGNWNIFLWRFSMNFLPESNLVKVTGTWIMCNQDILKSKNVPPGNSYHIC